MKKNKFINIVSLALLFGFISIKLVMAENKNKLYELNSYTPYYEMPKGVKFSNETIFDEKLSSDYEDDTKVLALFNNYIDNPSVLNEMKLKNFMLLSAEFSDKFKQLLNYTNKECFFDKILNNIKTKKKKLNSISEIENLYSDDMLTCIENHCGVTDFTWRIDNFVRKGIDMCIVNIQTVYNELSYTKVLAFCNCFVYNKVDFINKHYNIIRNNDNTQCKNLIWEAEQSAQTQCIMDILENTNK